MSEDIFDILLDKLDEAKEPITKAVCKGNAEGERGYGLLCGQLIGLDTAKRKVVELREKLKESDNE